MPRPFLQDRLIVFGRYPEPGKTKTRLIPLLGMTGAAHFHQRLMEKAVKTSLEFAQKWPAQVDISFAGGSKKKMKKWLGPGPRYTPQVEGNLGDRMSRALVMAFQQGCKRVVLVGTDVPNFSQRHLTEAFHALAQKEIVIGPSTDGGYWLLGMKRPLDVFRKIEWGSSEVLQKTLSLAKSYSLSVHLMDPLRDMDTPQDLAEWEGKRFFSGPYLSVIIPTLNEEKNVHMAIQSARNAEAEIIVVDGGSTDQTRKKAKDSGAKVIAAGRGRARQQNLGAKAANGKVLLFLHADTQLPSQYMSLIFETLLPKKTIAGAFKFKLDHEDMRMRLVEFNTNLRARLLQLPYGDQGIFMERDVFHMVRGFPESPIAEDLLLVRRLRSIGSVRIARDNVITSARRWKELGILHTTIINQIILVGILFRFSPQRLAMLYNQSPMFKHGPCKHRLKVFQRT